jgi:3-oxoacyl-[acyl-carrier-protein] synthase II
MAIAASDEALRDARIDTKILDLHAQREIGIVLGSGGGAQDFSEHQYRLWLEGKIKQVSLFSIPSGTMGTLSSEVSMHFGLRGPSHVVTTGCTSSTDAIAYAYRQIQLGVVPMMLSGGVDTPLAFGIMKGFTLMRIMTQKWNTDPERASRPFSADRDGFVIAEGSWMFLLEEYERARARGARMYAEIAGYGSTCEAFHRVRLQECGEEPARAMQIAMKEAGIEPQQVGYANLHGTSTQLNDRIETRALKLALGAHAYKVPMSAVKSQIGHPQGASGAAGLATTLVAMHHGQIPPTINIEQPDPECDLDYTPDVGRRAAIEYAICNCIAFGSKNSALVLRNLAT